MIIPTGYELRQSVQFDVVIKNGVIVTASDVYSADIGINDGRISAIAKTLEDGAETIDATGLYVLPGGIESHCHIAEPPLGDVVSADEFDTGSLAAACGGNTTFLPFANQVRGRTLRQAVDDYHRRASGKSYIDYGFHLIISEPNSSVLGQELPSLINDGYTSFKVFMAYDGFQLEDVELLDVLKVAKEHGALVMIHAENGQCISWLSSQLEEMRQTAPKYFSNAHHPVVEREATHRAISLSEIADTPILIVHVSASEAMEQIAWARSKGLNIHAETCPQYLFLSDNDFDRPDWEGSKFICAPPPRDAENQERLWTAIKTGVFDIVSSDHCPYRYGGADGKQAYAHSHPGAEPHFCHVAPGLPGIEVRLPLMFSEGVLGGRIELTQFVDLTATRAAKLYGLYPRKGTIAVGSDADIVLWDSKKNITIRHERLHDNCDYSPYEGFKVAAWPVRTILRGVTVWCDGEVRGKPGFGQFLERDRFKENPLSLPEIVRS